MEKLSEKQELSLKLQKWANSIRDLHSKELTKIGIDDFGDLTDNVPVLKEWMNEFWKMI